MILESTYYKYVVNNPSITLAIFVIVIFIFIGVKLWRSNE